jgi:hypothetical protein
MLKLLFVVACLFTSNAFADYIRVVGEGVSVEAAKENGFREAIQIRAGAVVLSERESSTYKLERDDISVYSAGYVKDFKIIRINSQASIYSVTMDVLVQDSKLFNQVLSSGKTNKDINGSSAAVSYRTYVNQQNQKDRLLSRVLATYPQHAFNIKQEEVSVSTDPYRNILLKVPYQLSWNYDYILAFGEAMKLLDDDRFGRFTPAPSNVVIMGKNPKDFVLGSSTQYRFNDIITLDRIKDSVTGGREVRILLSLRDDMNKVLFKSCVAPHMVNGGSSFYGIGDPRHFVIYGNAKEQGTFQVNLRDRNILDRTRTVELSVVASDNC